MERYRALALSFPLLAAMASAQETSKLPLEPFSIVRILMDYYLPFVTAVFLLFILLLVVSRVLKKGGDLTEFAITLVGIILAIAFIVAGIISIAAFSVEILIMVTGDETFAQAPLWVAPLVSEILYRITPLLDMMPDAKVFLDTILLVVLLAGGFLLILLGYWFYVVVPRYSFFSILRYRPGKITFKEVSKRGQEPLSPTVTFRVIDRYTNQPSPDVKVFLKHKEGGKVYTRYTDFNGEVVFQKIDGLFSQYYAYVEGDEDRKKYFVIRTSIGAETVT